MSVDPRTMVTKVTKPKHRFHEPLGYELGVADSGGNGKPHSHEPGYHVWEMTLEELKELAAQIDMAMYWEG